MIKDSGNGQCHPRRADRSDNTKKRIQSARSGGGRGVYRDVDGDFHSLHNIFSAPRTSTDLDGNSNFKNDDLAPEPGGQTVTGAEPVKTDWSGPAVAKHNPLPCDFFACRSLLIWALNLLLLRLLALHLTVCSQGAFCHQTLTSTK